MEKKKGIVLRILWFGGEMLATFVSWDGEASARNISEGKIIVIFEACKKELKEEINIIKLLYI